MNLSFIVFKDDVVSQIFTTFYKTCNRLKAKDCGGDVRHEEGRR